ncbi:hypothetical protein SERLADRAFT_360246 [Serpula lacrymans var. lacrymans S7.9]|uniref:PX domain-containing protein n=1 Tax=Serpula lacrymans var. lacrymans (strain S7.9) TaxID=578457 RepID=F8NND4_SERL9|nr:uncharacterized protein SERLADRAFT_360246 [Serpula lacrymans var. lacrymans S7.9]EGO27564.1 hypothetical protein SERLADRAFT_360246 [Serpula lacrymans var. lacrymans S7.9]
MPELNRGPLTPLRAHYLKKSLIQLQFRRELNDITNAQSGNVSTLSYLGSPFSPPPKGSPMLDLPFLRYFFRKFILSFPFMATAPKDFYSEKLQPFVASAFARNLSPTNLLDDAEEGSEQARPKMLEKLEKNLALLLGSGTKLVEQEEVVRLKQTDLDRLEDLAKKRQARNLKTKDVFEVNVVCVRTVTDRGRVRSRVHEEFIIRTRLHSQPDMFVSRRYGDFKTLADELRKAHPEEAIKSPPGKDKSAVTAPPQGAYSTISSFMSRAQSASMTDTQSNGSSDSLPFSPSQQGFPSRLSREKNRLTLRAYLHSLMASSAIASSPVLRSFLVSGPTTLSPEELDDVQRREEADMMRDEGRKRFAREVASRVDGLRDAVKNVTPNVNGLPANYKAVMEWARISLASTIFHLFIASDSSSETFASLKRIHGLMPYFMLKAALKISNPVGMIRSVLDLFLAQPFGGRSLLQRMFTSSLTEEVKNLEEDIESVQGKVDDPVICEKIRLFVYAPKEIQDMYKKDAEEERLSVLTTVLRSGEEPVLNRSQMHRVVRAHRAHVVYMKNRKDQDDSDDDSGPQNEDAWLFEDLKVLTRLYSELRDKEQLIALIFEGVTSELLKDIITIFYAPLAQVYRAASIADSLGDLQNFVNDLIRTVEQAEELSQEDPQRTVQTFIDLVQRHEQAFYHFVHKVHSNGEGLFDSLMRWIELFLTVVREGLGDPISLEYLLPHAGQERESILNEVDAVALYHYKMKVAYESRIRRRFGKAQGQSGADAEDEATTALVHGVVGEISLGELVQGDADDLAAEETDEDESESEGSSSEYETDSDGSYEDESSEESAAVVPVVPVSTKPVSRSATVTVTPVHIQSASRQSYDVPPARQRSLSLRSSKSLNLSRSSLSQRDATPLPLSSVIHKPLPPPPPGDSVPVQRRQSQESPSNHRPDLPSPRKSKAKKATDVLKPPDLHHIPQLLPLFVEMLRPLLRFQN